MPRNMHPARKRSCHSGPGNKHHNRNRLANGNLPKLVLLASPQYNDAKDFARLSFCRKHKTPPTHWYNLAAIDTSRLIDIYPHWYNGAATIDNTSRPVNIYRVMGLGSVCLDLDLKTRALTYRKLYLISVPAIEVSKPHFSGLEYIILFSLIPVLLILIVCGV